MAAARKHEKTTKTNGRRKSAPGGPPLTAITLQGFKSFRDETRIEIRPLTLLAGANSSGKSSAIQPLLLLKQTLEAPYDPGPLLLNGANASFSRLEQLLWQGTAKGDRAEAFMVGLSNPHETVRLFFGGAEKGGVEIKKVACVREDLAYELEPGMRAADLAAILKRLPGWDERLVQFRVHRSRCSLGATAADADRESVLDVDPFWSFTYEVLHMIHLPGLRGNPERNYQTAGTGDRYPGLFQRYVASVLLSWRETDDVRLNELDAAVSTLGLTWRIDPRRLDDASIEIRVGRLPSAHKGGAHDLVNIADVGFGVSQTLPVVVAVLAAAPGQVVYLEQPEIHLHPRAQVALARLLLDAAKRGAVVIAETHSDLLLRSVQRAVAAGEADPSLVALHWFERDKDGATKVTTAALDAAGTYGDWPVDFADVDLALERDFLDASLRHPA
jgi:hypothetical protein